MSNHTNKIRSLLMAGIIAIAFIGCAKVTNKDQKTLSYGTCEGCHTDYEHLKLVYSPDTAAPAGGCGGSAPHYEPYDRVFMGDDGYEAYKETVHGSMDCTDCHNGVDMTTDKTEAHSGDFLRHPSEEYDDKCGSCHPGKVEGYATNLHHGIGQKDKVTKRSGLSGHAAFNDLPQHQIEGYNANCATCHGTCGNCHVVRPPIAGGGLQNGHNFNGDPDMLATCIKCHTSRGGHAYLGIASGTVPDVHLTDQGFDCMNCHSGEEIHGTGEAVDFRYEYSALPSCDDCHTVAKNGEPIETSNSYHRLHYDDFNCQVCHSQDYNNCGSCHVHGDGARVPSYQGFKIAKNPIPEVKTGFEYVLVRRTLAAPDNWEVYGVDDYDNFEAFPTYNYTSPHNIIRWTTRTETDGSCSSNCHLRENDGQLINKDIYLMMDDLLEWEIDATGHLTVDDVLPKNWTDKD